MTHSSCECATLTKRAALFTGRRPLYRRLDSRLLQLWCGLLLLLVSISPSTLAQEVRSEQLTLEIDQRAVPVEIVYPGSGCAPCRLVVFSHGAFAAPERYRRLSEAWAQAGYLVAAPMHVDSELNATREQYDRAATMRTRLEDFALLSQGAAFASALKERRLTLSDGVIAAGHSYGALIAQLAGGATIQSIDPLPPEFVAAQQTIIGVIALSPPGPFPGSMEKDNWASITQPMLVVSGTTDILPGFVDDWRLHLVSFDAAQSTPAYALVFSEQDHYFNGAFGRPTDSVSASTQVALDTLNQHTISFMQAVESGAIPSAALWLALSSDQVEARVSPAVPAGAQADLR